MIKASVYSKVFDVFNALLMFGVIIITLYPFLYVASVSISDQYAVFANQVTFYPIGFDLTAYKHVFKDSRVWAGYANTIKYAVLGTTINLIFTSLTAYALSKKSLTWRKPISMAIVFTMMFSGGMIPLYLVVKNLQLIDTMWAIILPGTISTWNLMVTRTFFEGVPESLAESAYLDGASEYMVFYKIILPLSKPILLTIGLFYAVQHWNSFFNSLMFLNTPSKYPLQIILRNIIIGGEVAMKGGDVTEHRDMVVSQSIKTATIMVATIPILCIYPFIQKYFVKGVMIGSIKG